jgi:Na+/H+ antiporter NhaC
MKWFRFGACALLFLSLFFLPEANEDYLFLQTVKGMAEVCFGELPETQEKSLAGIHLESLKVFGGGTEADPEAMEREIRRLVTKELGRAFVGSDGMVWVYEEGQVRPVPVKEPGGIERLISLKLSVEKTPDGGKIRFRTERPELEIEKSAEYFNLFSLLPPFLAIVVALLFQKTILALFAGVWLGATLLEGMNPFIGFWRFVEKYLYEEALRNQFRVDIIGFVIALCATVGIMTRGGGIQGFVNKLVKLARSVRSTQFVTYLMGIAIFFDDYANCIIVGNTLRPLTDRMKISREKLSYIVDSTAAPVAGLSMLSTWIAYEVSTFSAQLPEAGVEEGAYRIFFETIPYRFYCIFTLAFIAFQIFLRRDFGPMLKAERRARTTGQVIRPEGRPLVSAALTKIEAKEGVPARWYNAVLPIVLILIVLVEELWRIGGGWDRPLSDILSPAAIREVLGNASADNSAQPIFFGAIAGFVLALILVISQRILTITECVKAAASSTKALAFAIVILLLAWCIGGVCSDMGTAHYLIALFKGVIHPVLFPTILFITSCLVAFATGSSWSTMSILLPNTVILAVKIGETSELGALPMLVISIGAVLEGSIFGDHCSPISDTTILSSVSSASDHLDHVKTQAPYAMVTMSAAVFIGYIPAALGFSPAISIILGLGALLGVLLLFGRKSGDGGPA